MTAKDTTKIVALEMLRAGLATQSEIAELAGVSRQLVRKWALAAEIDAMEARRLWLDKAWRQVRHRKA